MRMILLTFSLIGLQYVIVAQVCLVGLMLTRCVDSHGALK